MTTKDYVPMSYFIDKIDLQKKKGKCLIGAINYITIKV